MPNIEDLFHMGKATTNNEYQGGNLSSLSKGKRKKKTAVEERLFKLYTELHQGRANAESTSNNKKWELYSGTDSVFKEKLQSAFGAKDEMYSGMETNTMVKSVLTKVIQPFMSKDDIFSISPTGIDVETADRCSALINHQAVKGKLIEECYRVLKDSGIYGIGFIKVGWKVEFKTIPTRKIKKTIKEQPTSTYDTHEIEIGDITEETVVIEGPDFRAFNIGDILYPRTERWSDVPYVICKETVSLPEINRRYNKNYTSEEAQPDSGPFKTDFQSNTKDYIPGSDTLFGQTAKASVQILHFYFRDGRYYVASLEILDKKYHDGVNLLHEGTSVIPGMPIPIIPLVLEPISHRLEGESQVLLAQNEQRKITELSNLMMRTVRNAAYAPLFVTESAGLDIPAYVNRTPNMPFVLEDLEGMQQSNPTPLDPNSLMMKEAAYSDLQRITGQSDFAQGNIGKSARLTGVDSLVGMAMSRLSMFMTQFNMFLIEIADAMILMNRAFLPLDYAMITPSLYTEEAVQILEIPYPVNIKIATNISGSSDKSIRLGAYREAIQMAFQLESMSPGSTDIPALTQKFFYEADIKDISRYFLKSPMTLKESTQLRLIDAALAASQGSLPGQPTGVSTNSIGQSLDSSSISTGADAEGNTIDGNGQKGQIANLEEGSGKSGF